MRNNEGLRLDEIVKGGEVVVACKGSIIVTWIVGTHTLNTYQDTPDGWEPLECKTNYSADGIETALACAQTWLAYDYSGTE